MVMLKAHRLRWAFFISDSGSATVNLFDTSGLSKSKMGAEEPLGRAAGVLPLFKAHKGSGICQTYFPYFSWNLARASACIL